MLCTFGRTKFDETHPVCRSCQEQSVACGEQKVKKARKRYTSGPVMIDGRKAFATDYDLQTLNRTINSHGGDKVYRGIKRTWGRLLRNSVHHFGKAKGRRRVQVVRYVPNPSHFMDDDNLAGSLKPVLDVLVAEGVLLDDRARFLDLAEPVQEKGDARVEIFVEDV